MWYEVGYVIGLVVGSAMILAGCLLIIMGMLYLILWTAELIWESRPVRAYRHRPAKEKGAP